MELIVIPLAQRKIQQRGIPMAWIEETLSAPAQKVPGYGGRVVYQRRYHLPDSKEQLLRVICEETATRQVVVTAYLTSDTGRYWRT